MKSNKTTSALMLVFIFLASSSADVSAQGGLDTFVQELDQLAAQCAAMKEEGQSLATKSESKTAEAIISSEVPDYGKQQSSTAKSQAETLARTLVNLADRGTTLIERTRTETNVARRQEMVNEIRTMMQAGKAFTQYKIQLNVNLEDLKRRVELAQKGASLTNEKSAVEVGAAWSEDIGGGVFVDKAAQIEGLDRITITKATYDIPSQSIVLHANNKTWRVPSVDPDDMAVLIKCLYGNDPRQKIAVSLAMDPLNMGRKNSSIRFHEKVFFGCSRLVDTKVGRVLLNAEELLGALYIGKDRQQTLLTQTLGYYSLLQLAFDHPAAQDQPTALLERKMDWRVWIDPAPIRASVRNDRLQFETIKFQMHMETIRLDSPKFFKGTQVGNPGGDYFVGYFNKHFEKFFPATIGKSSSTGRLIRPFQDLQPIAEAVSILLWIKGDRKNSVPMDTAWAMKYIVANVPTARDLGIPSIPDALKDIKGPVIVYNEIGPTRIIDEHGRTLKIHYNNGQIDSMTYEGRAVPVNQ